MRASAGPGAPVDTTVRVVVVHGIGSQPLGATAARWSDAFVRFGRDAGYVPDVSTAMFTDPSRVTVTLTEPPASCSGPGRTVQIDVEEAYWADSFAEPTLGRVLRFLLTVAPVLAITQSLTIWRTRDSVWPNGWPRVQAAGQAAAMVAPLAAGVVALGLAAPVIAVLLLLLLVGAVLPISSVRRAVGKALGWLSTSIGDAYLFVADPVNRAAMETRLAQRFAEPSPTPGYRTVVLAHSQGAALAYRALTALEATQRPGSLVTVGSGVGRLHQVGLLQTIPWFLTPLFVAIVGGAATGIALADRWWTPGLLLAAGLLTLLAWRICAWWLDGARPGRLSWWRPGWWASGERGTRKEERTTPALLPALAGMTWLDIWASFDPVPNGRTALDTGDITQGRYQLARVAGEQSVVRDHVRYDRDWDQTLPLVLTRLLDPSRTDPIAYVGVRPRDGGPDQLGRIPLTARDWWGLALRTVPLVAAAVALGRADLFRLGQWLRTAPPGLLDSTISAVFVPIRGLSDLLDHPAFRSPRPQTLLGIVAVLALGVGGSILARRVLAFFQRRETVRWLGAGGLLPGGPTRQGGRWTGWRWPLAFAGVALAAAVVPVLLFTWDRGVHWTQEQAVEAYLRAVAEDDVHAQCQMTTHPEDGTGPLEGCGTPDEDELLRTCEDARKAVAALDEDAVRIENARVEIDWAPEVPPACDDPQHPLLLPTRVALVDGDWLVAEVDSPGDE